MTDLNFDASGIEPIGSFEPLPADVYTVIITASEKKATKDGEGEYIQLTYSVVDGEYRGRKIFDRLNMINKNKTAVEIAQRTLATICRCVGVMRPRTTEELHDKPFMIKIAIQPAKGEYAASNVIREYRTAAGEKVTGDKVTASPAKRDENSASPDGKKKKPWEK
jgi:hypothetical protein